MRERITYQLCKNILLVVMFLPIVAHSTVEIPIKKEGLKHNNGFLENKGQIIDQNNKPNPAVLYLLNTPGMNVQLRRGGFSYDLYRISNIEQRMSNNEAAPDPAFGTRHVSRVTPSTADTSRVIYTFHRIDIDLQNANPNPVIETAAPSKDYLNYYTTGTSEEG